MGIFLNLCIYLQQSLYLIKLQHIGLWFFSVVFGLGNKNLPILPISLEKLFFENTIVDTEF